MIWDFLTLPWGYIYLDMVLDNLYIAQVMWLDVIQGSLISSS